MDSITLVEGIGYCPHCSENGKSFRLTPHLLETTRGTDIPMFCRYCKQEYVVDIDVPGAAHIRRINQMKRRNGA